MSAHAVCESEANEQHTLATTAAGRGEVEISMMGHFLATSPLLSKIRREHKQLYQASRRHQNIFKDLTTLLDYSAHAQFKRLDEENVLAHWCTMFVIASLNLRCQCQNELERLYPLTLNISRCASTYAGHTSPSKYPGGSRQNVPSSLNCSPGARERRRDDAETRVGSGKRMRVLP